MPLTPEEQAQLARDFDLSISLVIDSYNEVIAQYLGDSAVAKMIRQGTATRLMEKTLAAVSGEQKEFLFQNGVGAPPHPTEAGSDSAPPAGSLDDNPPKLHGLNGFGDEGWDNGTV